MGLARVDRAPCCSLLSSPCQACSFPGLLHLMLSLPVSFRHPYFTWLSSQRSPSERGTLFKMSPFTLLNCFSFFTALTTTWLPLISLFVYLATPPPPGIQAPGGQTAFSPTPVLQPLGRCLMWRGRPSRIRWMHARAVCSTTPSAVSPC